MPLLFVVFKKMARLISRRFFHISEQPLFNFPLLRVFEHKSRFIALVEGNNPQMPFTKFQKKGIELWAK